MITLVSKLNKIQVELKAPKNQRNNFGGYNYRSCEDIMLAIKPLLVETGLVLTVCDDVVLVGDRFYIKATATITDGANSISNTAFAREPESKKGMDEAQITGATSSYARKYALNGLLCIDDIKDPDATNTHGKDEKTPAQKASETKAENKKTKDELLSFESKMKEYISKQSNLTVLSKPYNKVCNYVNQLQKYGLNELATEIICLLDDKMEKDFIPNFTTEGK